MSILVLLAVCFLAYANGANDNFKGVVSLFGSRTSGYRTAIGWATLSTFAGSVTAIFLAQSLLRRFSGKGLVPDSLVGSEHFLLAVAVGAGATVILATLSGFPIATTHALTGAMVGSGWVAVGSQVQLGVLGRAFVLPLLLSPVLAVALGATLNLVFRVSVGALFGIGLTSRQVDFCVARNILLSWLVTLPCAAAIGALVYGLATP